MTLTLLSREGSIKTFPRGLLTLTWSLGVLSRPLGKPPVRRAAQARHGTGHDATWYMSAGAPCRASGGGMSRNARASVSRNFENAGAWAILVGGAAFLAVLAYLSLVGTG